MFLHEAVFFGSFFFKDFLACQAIPAPPGMAPPKPKGDSEKAEEGAKEPKEPPVKAKPIGAEMSPPPTASPSSRPLPPPPKTVAPAKPGDVSKAKAETKDPTGKSWVDGGDLWL